MRAAHVAAIILALSFAVPPAGALLGAPATLATLSVDPGSGADLLVGYREGQESVAAEAIRAAGGTLKHALIELRVLVVESDDAGLLAAALASVRAIEFIESDGESAALGAEWNGAEWNGAEWNGAEWNGAEWNAQNGAPEEADDPGRFDQWGLVAANVPAAWSVHPGSRAAKLCVLDSGIDTDHRDLVANLWTDAAGLHGFNAFSPGAQPEDDAGHGTHVAGIAAAEVGNAFGVAGVGNVRIQSVKVLDASGHGTESDLARGLVWCANEDADVGLMALGVTKATQTLQRAIAYAAGRDVLLVASAGNAGPCSDCVGYPASDARVLAVAATTKPGKLAPFSSTGPEVDLAAPGADVLSTYKDGRFVYGSGTSQAAAFVAGAATLLRDADPSLDAAGARDALTSTTRNPAGGNQERGGAGALDVGGALAAAS